MEESAQELDCAVCLQKCHHPTKLPCGHIFCFLCVKGVAIQSKKCAMCRAEIPADYFDHPVLLEKMSPQSTVENPQLENQWYYEGRNGWWKYDERSNIELERAYVNGDRQCSLLLAGALYSIDFQAMIQVRHNDHVRRRRVRRETPLFPAKGTAGIKSEIINIEETKVENEVTPDTNIQTSEEIVEISDDDSNNTETLVVDDVSEELHRIL